MGIHKISEDLQLWYQVISIKDNLANKTTKAYWVQMSTQVIYLHTITSIKSSIKLVILTII